MDNFLKTVQFCSIIEIYEGISYFAKFLQIMLPGQLPNCIGFRMVHRLGLPRLFDNYEMHANLCAMKHPPGCAN